MAKWTPARILKKAGKILMFLLGGVLLLVAGVYIYLNTKSGKQFLKEKAESFLNKKLKTKLSIGSIDFTLPNYFELNKVYLEDRNRDTLLYGEQLSVRIALLKLISGETDIRKVGLKNIQVNLNRAENDSFFNYQFIADAFAGKKAPEKVSKDTAAMKLMLRQLNLDRVAFHFRDENAGSFMDAYVQKLDLGLNTFQPDKLRFGINTLAASGIRFSMLTTKPAQGDDDTVKTPDNKLMLTAKKLQLSDVEVDIQDKISGFNYYNLINKLQVSNAVADLKTEKIKADQFAVSNSAFRIVTNPVTTERIKDTIVQEAPKWLVEVKQIQLDNDTVMMDNWVHKKTDGFDAQHIALTPITFHASNTFFTIDSSSTLVTHLKLKDQSGFALDTLHASVIYSKHQITAEELYVQTPQTLIRNKVQLFFEDLKTLTQQPEKTQVNIELKESHIGIDDLYTLLPAVKKSLAPEKFAHQILKLNTVVSGTLKRLNIPMLQVSGLKGSYVNANATIINVTDVSKMMFDIHLQQAIISKNDLAKFVQFTPAGFAQLPPVINIRATALGSMQDMVADLNVSGANLLLDARATLKHLNDMKTFHYDALIRNSRISKSFLLAFIPKEKLPASIELPSQFMLTGTAAGDVNNILTDIKLGGSYGIFKAKGYVKNFTNPQKSRYDLKVSSEAFAIGKLLKKDSILGTVSMQGGFAGQGFDVKTMQTVADININSIGFKNYDYSNIHLKAELNKGLIKSNGSADDPNLRFQYTASADLAKQHPAGELWLHLDTARLHALHLIEDTLNIALTTHIIADDISPDNLNASLRVDSMYVNMNKQQLYLDSIVAIAKGENGKQELTLRSAIMDLDANGTFQYDKLLPSVLQYVNNYYKVTKDTAAIIASEQQIALKGIIREHPLLKRFVPGLLKYDTITFDGNYSSKATDSALNFNLKMPYVVYTDKKLYNGSVSVVSANEQLRYAVKTDTIQNGSNKLYGTQLAGYIANDSLIADALTKDNKGNNLYLLGATASIDGENYTFRLKKDLVLNYKSWTVDPLNAIFYSAQGFYVNNFKLNYRQSSIDIQSEQQQAGSPVNLAVNNFLISDITSLLNKDTLIAAGIINAKAKVSEFDKTLPAFEGQVKIDSIYYKRTAVGNLLLNTQKAGENHISADGSFTGNGNDLKMNGNYFLNNTEKQFDAAVDITQFNIASIEGFTNGQISNSKGSVNGNITANGKFAEPTWNGVLNFKDPSFRLAKFGTSYRMENQQIKLDYPDISFNNFTVQDSANHKLVVNGTVSAKKSSTFGLDLKVKSDNFIVVNTPKATNDLIYGFAAVNTNVQVGGTSAAPDIQGTISLTDNTDATLVLPEKNMNREATKSVVRFIDKDTFPLPEAVLFVPEDPESVALNTFLNYNLNIQLSPKSALTVVIDPGTGDEIRLKGDAKLNVGVDPGGNIVLAGNYSLDQGHYILHYQFLERKFNLLSGSTVAFGGGPLDAQLDIRAEYIANTSAIDLVGNELGDVDNKTATTFNQKIPFRVLLFIKGTLKDLQITFDIQLPDENTGLSNTIVTTVDNKLTQLRADPAAINKQVFSLLVLNRFVGEQSMDFFKGNGDGVSDIARQSVSKFLSAALDQIASDLIKGVDIDLNLNSYKDYSSGDEQQRTDLNIGVSKRFMDDRLSISVGKNLGIEGQDRSAKARQQNTASYMPDATINYKLSKDGRYMIRAYSKNKFEVIMDGYVVETGLSFIVSMDYEKFNELFNNRKRRKKG
jgi:hypothetical protein